MRKLNYILAIALLITGLCNTASAQVNYSSAIGGFNASLPCMPHERKQAEPSGITAWYYNCNSGSTRYLIIVTDYPSGQADKSKIADILQKIKTSFTNSLRINKITDESPVTKNGYEGVYYKGESTDIFFVKHDYLVENRLYQIAIVRQDRYPTTEEIDSFITSFEIVR